ncbi:hypothetical protein GRI33_06295 [Brucella sp. BO3]|uniref:hypothetical protein n=1 Tax=unclassified Brucella TaxID=2632610 RepID=UPI00114CE1DE|nr:MULTISPECIES: hypothetical protein [unclassified Brucella]QMV26560.1 hypothetical protein GRI33_06295 [Brucella sp. BO3]
MAEYARELATHLILTLDTGKLFLSSFKVSLVGLLLARAGRSSPRAKSAENLKSRRKTLKRG